MQGPRFLLLGVLLLELLHEVIADCNVAGLHLTCPTIFDRSDATYCCKSPNVEVCCNAKRYFDLVLKRIDVGTIVGILIGVSILLVGIILCCCFFCGCCLFAKRRTQGTIIYDRFTDTTALPLHPGVNTFQPSQMPPPPPSYQPVDPNLIHKPPPSQSPSPPPYFQPMDTNLVHTPPSK